MIAEPPASQRGRLAWALGVLAAGLLAVLAPRLVLSGLAALAGAAAALLGASIEPVRALAGILVGGGGLYAVAFGYRALTGRDGLGGGDVKLLAMIGAFLGPAGAFLTILLGSFTGSLFALAWLKLGRGGRRSELPFGTFLAPGAIVALFYGSKIVELYWGLFSR